MKNLCFKTIPYIFTILISLAFSFIISENVFAGDLSLHTLYVEQGDCIVIESNHHYMLVDSGFSKTSESVLAYLDSLNIPENKLDYVVATHPDGDHVGGFSDIFNSYDVNQVIYSPCTKYTEVFMDFISSVKSHKFPFRTPVEGESWRLGDATVTVIYDGSRGTTFNECSIVLRIECDGKSILLTGDLPSTMEKVLMKQGYRFDADILKVAHHGAGSSTSADFLDTVKPQYAVISCSANPGVIFPRDSILKKLARRFIKTYRTSDGNVVISITDGVISTENKENNGFISIKGGTVTLSNNVFYATGKAIKPTVTLTVNGFVVPKNQYTVSYSSNKTAGTATVKVKGTEEKYLGTIKSTFSILPAKEKLKCSLNGVNQIDLLWNTQSKVSGYTILYSTDKSFNKDLHYKNISSSKITSKSFSKLAYNTTYYFKIRAYCSNLGFGKWSSVRSIKTAPNPTPPRKSIRRIKVLKNNYVKVRWKLSKRDKALGYRIQYSTSKKFSKNVVSVKTKNLTKNYRIFKKMKPGKKYYFRLRAYNKYAKGKWSKVVSIKL